MVHRMARVYSIRMIQMLHHIPKTLQHYKNNVVQDQWLTDLNFAHKFIRVVIIVAEPIALVSASQHSSQGPHMLI